jgi:hypothetical protein
MDHGFQSQIAPNADERVALIDALYRFAAGQGDRDCTMFESAFAEAAVWDFTHPAARLGRQIGIFEGRAIINDIVMGATANLDMTHSVSTPAHCHVRERKRAARRPRRSPAPFP